MGMMPKSAYSFIFLSIQQIFVEYLTDIILNIRDLSTKKIDKILCSHRYYFLMGLRQTMKKQSMYVYLGRYPL